ncbi:MAG: hypothetical protein ACRDHN_00270, partial [Thermomicrobiales bacterium]
TEWLWNTTPGRPGTHPPNVTLISMPPHIFIPSIPPLTAAGVAPGRRPGATGFSPAREPLAALVFASAEGDDDPGDVLIVELINPTYDPTSSKATYEINVLADDTAVGMTLQSEPVAMAAAIRGFDAASLFIDDCPDGDVD